VFSWYGEKKARETTLSSEVSEGEGEGNGEGGRERERARE
jgi:hypothetical protein